MDAKQCAEFLNQAMDLDPDCLESFFKVRIPCNTAIAEHPTIQVGDVGLRFIGLLNGMLLSSGSPDVVVEVREDDGAALFFTTKPYSECI